MLSQGPCVVRCQHHPAGSEKQGGRKRGLQKPLPGLQPSREPRPAPCSPEAETPQNLPGACPLLSLNSVQFGLHHVGIFCCGPSVVHLKELLEK